MKSNSYWLSTAGTKRFISQYYIVQCIEMLLSFIFVCSFPQLLLTMIDQIIFYRYLLALL